MTTENGTVVHNYVSDPNTKSLSNLRGLNAIQPSLTIPRLNNEIDPLWLAVQRPYSHREKNKMLAIRAIGWSMTAFAVAACVYKIQNDPIYALLVQRYGPGKSLFASLAGSSLPTIAMEMVVAVLSVRTNSVSRAALEILNRKLSGTYDEPGFGKAPEIPSTARAAASVVGAATAG